MELDVVALAEQNMMDLLGNWYWTSVEERFDLLGTVPVDRYGIRTVMEVWDA